MRLRTVFLIAASIPLLLMGLIKALFFVDYLNVSGYWPFEPLAKSSTFSTLTDGSTITVEQTEDRDFTAKGYDFSVFFSRRGSSEREKVASWYGREASVEAYVLDHVVVVAPPGGHTLMVRLRKDNWKSISFQFTNSAKTSERIAYANGAAMDSGEYNQVLERLGNKDFRKGTIRSFEPQSQIVKVDVEPLSLYLKLSKDGNTLRLLKITSGDGALTSSTAEGRVSYDDAGRP